MQTIMQKSNENNILKKLFNQKKYSSLILIMSIAWRIIKLADNKIINNITILYLIVISATKSIIQIVIIMI